MKKIILLGFFTAFTIINAQFNRFVYEFKFVRDTISKNSFTNILHLDTDGETAKFYYQELYELDSVQKATKNSAGSISFSKSIMLKRKVNSFKNSNFVSVDTDYFNYESTDILQWKILPDLKSYKNFILQKATTNFGGRKWIAWFSKDIPINEGPYKFHGLPGLIFQIEDEQHYFSFNLIEIKKVFESTNTERFLETNFGKKALPITFNKYQKLLLNAFHNPYSEIRNKLAKGEDYSFSAYDREIKTVQDLDELRKIIQEEILRNNNPIEKNKEPNYQN
ncbi:GLPGLI family protein [Kaistella polysaccharea]|uniref:GLPGLI family protein n=1 Tax=Kaistella polysaccharea TaxID=2878534 RepID=UPI001CF1AE30|nr:GLPGLI family protein [Kaistella polysaccharea]